MNESFTMIPDSAYAARRSDGRPLSDGAVLLLGRLLSYSRLPNGAHPSVGRLAEHQGKTRRTIQRLLGELVSAGVIQRLERSSSTSRYVVAEVFNPPSKGTTVSSGGGDKNDAGGATKMSPNIDRVNKEETTTYRSTCGGGGRSLSRESEDAAIVQRIVDRGLSDTFPGYVPEPYAEATRKQRATALARTARQLARPTGAQPRHVLAQLLVAWLETIRDPTGLRDPLVAFAAWVKNQDIAPPPSSVHSQHMEMEGPSGSVRAANDNNRGEPTSDQTAGATGALRSIRDAA